MSDDEIITIDQDGQKYRLTKVASDHVRQTVCPVCGLTWMHVRLEWSRQRMMPNILLEFASLVFACRNSHPWLWFPESIINPTEPTEKEATT